MKFGIKLVFSIIMIISIILAFSRYIIVKQNFMNSIQIRANQNINQNATKKYYLESNIVREIENGHEITEEKIVEYIKSLYLYLEDEAEMIALYTDKGEKIFSNFEQIDNIKKDTFFSKDIDSYALKKLENKHYLLFTSYWTINNEDIYMINIYDVTDIYEERDRQMHDIVFADLIILGIASIFIVIFSLIFTNPIRKLNIISKKIASGNLNERVKINTKDEVGELANSFNIMADEIESKINSLNLSIRQKDDFVNAFTHEIKTPITAIMGYSDMLRLKKCDEELTKKALNHIYSESKRLEELSYKLMNLMSISENRIELENIKIKEFINKIVEKIILDKIQIVTQLDEATLNVDKNLLEIVIRNLIENSKKAKPKDNKIFIKGEVLESGEYEISIIDKGIGIPNEHINRVTEDFYMVDKSRSKENGGSGIGLSLCKKILEVHKSEIKIESKENIGTRISFKLEVQKDEN